MVLIGGFPGLAAKCKAHTSGRCALQARHNPADWAGRTGQDFERDHAAPDVDFATVHVWPDNWNKCAADVALSLARKHLLG